MIPDGRNGRTDMENTISLHIRREITTLFTTELAKFLRISYLLLTAVRQEVNNLARLVVVHEFSWQ